MGYRDTLGRGEVCCYACREIGNAPLGTDAAGWGHGEVRREGSTGRSTRHSSTSQQNSSCLHLSVSPSVLALYTVTPFLSNSPSVSFHRFIFLLFCNPYSSLMQRLHNPLVHLSLYRYPPLSVPFFFYFLFFFSLNPERMSLQSLGQSAQLFPFGC